MSGCVGSPTNGSEKDQMVSGHGDASINPSWAPCEVSAELSIVGAASGGSDVGGGASQSRRVWSQARLAARTVIRVIQGGRLLQAAWLHRARLFGPRDGCGAPTHLLSGWVMEAHGLPVQPGSVLLWPASCGNAVLEKSEARRILDYGARSGSAAEALQGAHGADVVKRRRCQGDDDPGRLDRRSGGMEDMRWAGTHDGGRLQRDAGQFRYNDRQVQNLD